jgi:hypothetical protein
MRKWLVVISLALFVTSLPWLFVARALPAGVEQETALLNYEHKGRFDYLAYLKPSYLFGPEPEKPPSPPQTPTPPPPLSNLKYPYEAVDRFKFSFSYNFVPEQPVKGITEEVEVTATGINADKKQTTLTLYPKSTAKGGFTADFDLIINDEISGGDITVNIYVSSSVEIKNGTIFESFIQPVNIRSKKPVWEVDRASLSRSETGYLGVLSYEQKGKVDFSVVMKADSPLGEVTLKPPPVPPPPPIPTPTPTPAPPLKTLERGQTVFTKLVDSMDVTFNYSFMSDKPASTVTTDVEITAVLEATKLWSKKFPILYTNKGRDFSVTFPLDLVSYLELLDAIRKETATSGESYMVTVTADVHTVADTQFGLVDETFSQAMKGTLKGNVLEWDKELVQSKPGSIKTTKVIPNPNSYLGLSVAKARILSTALAGIFFVFFLVLGAMYVRFKPPELTQIQKEVLRARKRYSEMIAEATIEDEGTITVGSMQDLIKVASELGKPIIHQTPSVSGEPDSYYVVDGVTRYRYLLAADGKGQENNTSKTEKKVHQ